MNGTFDGDMFFNLFPWFFGIAFIFILGIILMAIIGSIRQWKKNEDSPRLIVPAIVKTKRTNVKRDSNHQNEISSTSTTYYVTFEFESGDRLELRVLGKEYGLLADGDVGTLTFQGTRYLDFVREV